MSHSLIFFELSDMGRIIKYTTDHRIYKPSNLYDIIEMIIPQWPRQKTHNWKSAHVFPDIAKVDLVEV
jgi:hypothetical protein